MQSSQRNAANQRGRRLRIENLEDRRLLSAQPDAEKSHFLHAESELVEWAIYEADSFDQPANEAGSVSPLSTTPQAITAPATPTGLSAQVTSSTAIFLDWNNVSGADNYRLYRSTSPSGPWDFAHQIYFASGSAYSDSGNHLNPGTTYYYRVAANNAAGDSPLSGTVSAITIPAIPTGLTAQPTGPTSILIDWNDSTGADTYHLLRSTSPSGPFDFPIYSGPDSTYNDSGNHLIPGTTYYYALRASNTSGDSPQSAIVSATPQAITAPATPTGLSAQATGSTSIFMDWNNVSGADNYRLYRSTSASGPWDFAHQIYYASGATYNDSGNHLNPGTTYYYRVAASNAAGDSPLSGTVSAITFADDHGNTPETATPVVPPQSITGTLTWPEDEDWFETAYEVGDASRLATTLGTLSEGRWILYDRDGSTQLTSGSLGGAPFQRTVQPGEGGTYFLKIYSPSGATGTYTIEVIPLDPPSAPSNVAAEARGPGSIRVRWSVSITDGDYYILRAPTESGPYEQIDTVPAHQTFYDDNDLVADTPYFYRIHSKSGGLFSLPSSIAMARTLPEAGSFNSGPRVTNPANLGTRSPGVSFIDITFNEPVDPGSFTAVDILLRRGTTTIAVQQPYRPDPDNQPLLWRISFAAQTAPGTYVLRVGPYITDLVGNLMNQDNDTTNGEGVADRFNGFFRVSAPLPPTAPQNLTALYSEPNTVTLAWGDVPGADNYRLYRATSPSGPWDFGNQIYYGEESGFPDVASNLTPGQTYYYAVRASNSGGDSGVSNIAEVDIPSGVQYGIDRWWATAGLDTRLEVTWTVHVPIDGAYTLDIGGLDSWRLVSDSPSLLIDGSPSGTFEGVNPTVAIPALSGGVHRLTIVAFAVPTHPVVERIALELVPANELVQTRAISTYLIADAQDIATQSASSRRPLFPVTLFGRETVFNTPLQLAQYFAPILTFDPLERYSVPMRVDDVLTEVARSTPPDTIGATGNGADDDWLSLDTYATGLYNPSNKRATVYASVNYAADVNELAVNYWFFYARSNWQEYGGYNTHEGDWEGMTIFLKQSRHWVPDRIALAQHVEVGGDFVPFDQFDGGDRIRWVDLPVNTELGGERVQLYIGLGGHATYAHRSITQWVTPGGVKNELHQGGGIQYSSPPFDVSYLPPLGLPTAPDWLRYPGHWGAVNGPGNSGPRGPAFQNPRIGGDASGLRWIDPWEWSDGFNWFVPPAPESAAIVDTLLWTMVVPTHAATLQTTGNVADPGTMLRLPHTSTGADVEYAQMGPDIASQHALMPTLELLGSRHRGDEHDPATDDTTMPDMAADRRRKSLRRSPLQGWDDNNNQ